VIADWQIITADVFDGLATLPDKSVHTVVTSPPYWSLRDYGTGEWEGGSAECDHKKHPPAFSEKALAKSTIGAHANTGHAQQGYGDTCGKCGARRQDKQLGLEPTIEEYVESMVRVFREVWRVLRDDGTVWMNLGDSYAGGGGYYPDSPSNQNGSLQAKGNETGARNINRRNKGRNPSGLKNKDLCMIPARVALALQADGWYIRSEITWCKRAPMPESVTDRPTSATEKIYLLSKSAKYFYDSDAVRMPSLSVPITAVNKQEWEPRVKDGLARESFRMDKREYNPAGRNLWNYWLLSPEPYKGPHFATFPSEIPRRAILAGTSERGCCAECGAPWRRVVERTAMVIARSDRQELMGEYGRTQSSGTMLEPATSITKGWQPTCSHDAPIIPCTVLDPFSGVGTTVLTANRLGRKGIGIELNPVWAQESRDRVVRDAPLFNGMALEEAS
jgi:DNA modification methylase